MPIRIVRRRPAGRCTRPTPCTDPSWSRSRAGSPWRRSRRPARHPRTSPSHRRPFRSSSTFHRRRGCTARRGSTGTARPPNTTSIQERIDRRRRRSHRLTRPRSPSCSSCSNCSIHPTRSIRLRHSSCRSSTTPRHRRSPRSRRTPRPQSSRQPTHGRSLRPRSMGRSRRGRYCLRTRPRRPPRRITLHSR
jgi:hypothetical protein